MTALVTVPRQEWTYWAVLKLQDDSGTLPAILYREDGERFFDGVRADALRHDGARLTKLRTTLQTLTAGSQQGSGGGSVYLANLCIKSYYAAERRHAGRSRR